MSLQLNGLHFPCAPVIPRPTHTSAVCSCGAVGIPHRTSCPNRSGEAHSTKNFPHWDGKVRKEHFAFLPHRYDPRRRKGLDINIEPVDKRISFLGGQGGQGDLFNFYWRFRTLDRLHPKIKKKEKEKPTEARSPGWKKKCLPLRSLAVWWGLPCFFCRSWDWSVDRGPTLGRAPLPACVLGNLWTAVGWKGAEFQTRSRSGQSSCESSWREFVCFLWKLCLFVSFMTTTWFVRSV